jgi:hypothetical protein
MFEGDYCRMARQIDLFSAVLGVIARGAIAMACVALICMTLVEGWQVFARYVLNDSPSWTEPGGAAPDERCHDVRSGRGGAQ